MIDLIKNEVSDIPSNVLMKLQRDIEEIKTALLGNEYNPDGGLLQRTAELECEIEKLKARYDRIMYWASGAGAVASLVIAVIAFILDKLI